MTASPSAPGTVVDIDGRPTLHFERRFPHPVGRVWRAVTDPDEMKAWFPSAVLGERATGSALIFDDDAHRAAARAAGEPTRDDGPMFHGTVQRWEPPSSWSFTWGGELIEISLRPDGDETVMTFTQRLSHESVAARNGAGWHQCLAALSDALDAPPTGADEAGWEAVYEDYLDRVGPSLGTPNGDGSMTWERATHVDAERVVAATSDGTELEAWGASASDASAIRCDADSNGTGTRYRITVDGIGADPERAAVWHARLLQLDMYLAAGQLVPADPDRVLGEYRSALSRTPG